MTVYGVCMYYRFATFFFMWTTTIEKKEVYGLQWYVCMYVLACINFVIIKSTYVRAFLNQAYCVAYTKLKLFCMQRVYVFVCAHLTL